MSLERHDHVDACGLRDGWVVISIHHFDTWHPVEDRIELLRAKIETCLRWITSPAFQARWYRTPVRIELVGVEPLPDEASDLCREHGVIVRTA